MIRLVLTLILMTTLAAQAEPATVTWSQNGRLVAGVIEAKKRVAVWDVTARKRLFTLPEEGVEQVAFSPDGRFLLTTRRGNVVNLYGATSGKLVWTRVQPAGARSRAFFAPGHVLIHNSGGSQNSLRWRDLANGHEVRALPCFAVWPTHDRKVLAVVHEGKLSFVDAATGKSLRALMLAGWRPLGFTPGKRRFGLYQEGGAVRILEVDTRDEVALEGVPEVESFTPDNRLVISDGPSICMGIFNPANKQQVKLDPGYLAGFRPDGKRVVLQHLDEGSCWIADTQTGKRLLSCGVGVPLAAFSPDGTRLAALGSESIDLYDGKSLKKLSILP